MALCSPLFERTGASVHVVQLIGNTPLARLMYGVHLGDQLSVKLASLAGVDPVDIRLIDFLKGELAELD
jgi:hypothetical protein